jgi:hypothetical protein
MEMKNEEGRMTKLVQSPKSKVQSPTLDIRLWTLDFLWFRHSVAPGKFCNGSVRSGQLLPVISGEKDFIPAKAALLAGGTTVAPQSPR